MPVDFWVPTASKALGLFEDQVQKCKELGRFYATQQVFLDWGAFLPSECRSTLLGRIQRLDYLQTSRPEVSQEDIEMRVGDLYALKAHSIGDEKIFANIPSKDGG